MGGFCNWFAADVPDNLGFFADPASSGLFQLQYYNILNAVNSNSSPKGSNRRNCCHLLLVAFLMAQWSQVVVCSSSLGRFLNHASKAFEIQIE
eukprot:4450689-Amphidinium_carterae.1